MRRHPFLQIPLEDKKTAYVPFDISSDDFEMIMDSLHLFKSRLVITEPDKEEEEDLIPD